MFVYELFLFAILSNIVFTSQTEEGEAPVSTFANTDTFDCMKITNNDRLPEDWNWTSVGDKLDTKECFERIAANGQLYKNVKSARELFQVMRASPDTVESRGFCVLAPAIAKYALEEDLTTLEACKNVTKNDYSLPVIAILFQRADYKLEDIGVDPKYFGWGDFGDPSEIDRGVRQRLWLALAASLHDSCDDKFKEMRRLNNFFYCIIGNHGIELDPFTPFTALDKQIVRLLPIAIEYIMSKDVVKDHREYLLGSTKDLYVALKSKVANEPALSLYLHSRFIVNPAVDLQSALSPAELPPINDIQMTKELFAYGDNLDKISDPMDRKLAATARERLEGLLFHKAEE